MRPLTHSRTAAKGHEIMSGPIVLGFGDFAAVLLAIVLLMVSALWPRSRRS